MVRPSVWLICGCLHLEVTGWRRCHTSEPSQSQGVSAPATLAARGNSPGEATLSHAASPHSASEPFAQRRRAPPPPAPQPPPQKVCRRDRASDLQRDPGSETLLCPGNNLRLGRPSLTWHPSRHLRLAPQSGDQLLSSTPTGPGPPPPAPRSQLRTCAPEGGGADRPDPRPSGIHLRPAGLSGALVPARVTHPSRARRSRGPGSARLGLGQSCTRGSGGSPPPAAAGRSLLFTPLPTNLLLPSEPRPRLTSPQAPPSPSSDWSVSRGGGAAASTSTRGRQPGWAGGAGWVTCAGGRGGEGAAGGHFFGGGPPPPQVGSSREPRTRASSGLSWKIAAGLRCSPRNRCPNPSMPCTHLRIDQTTMQKICPSPPASEPPSLCSPPFSPPTCTRAQSGTFFRLPWPPQMIRPPCTFCTRAFITFHMM